MTCSAALSHSQDAEGSDTITEHDERRYMQMRANVLRAHTHTHTLCVYRLYNVAEGCPAVSTIDIAAEQLPAQLSCSSWTCTNIFRLLHALTSQQHAYKTACHRVRDKKQIHPASVHPTTSIHQGVVINER
jgi:hypothetical protein